MKTQVRPVEPALEEPRKAPLWHRTVAFVLKAFVAVAILAAGAYAAREVMSSAPVAERKERPRVARLVDVIRVEPATQGPQIEAWGEVVAERALSLRPEVGGRVEWLNPALTAGGRVAAGEELMRLDDRTLRLDLARAEAAMRQIEARIRLEKGQRQRAESDLERVPTKLTEEQRALVLRVPQMAELEAELAAAEAERESAAVALSKVTVTAPFDALVVAEQVTEGMILSANAEAATLVAADAFRVELAVPVTALDWIEVGGDQTVRLTQPDGWPEGAYREGRIEHLSPDLTETGRMAELIATAPDPLAETPANSAKPKLLMGSFLKAEIEGRPVEDAVALPRAYLRDDNTVWIMDGENRLEVRAVEVAWRGADTVLVSGGLEAGERVVTTHLATFADGMELRTGDRSEAEGGAVAGRAGGAAGG